MADTTRALVQQPPADPEAGYPAGVGAVVEAASLPFDVQSFGIANTLGKPPGDPEAGYPAGTEARVRVTAQNRDDALVAWVVRRGGTDAIENRDGLDAPNADGMSDSTGGIFDDVFAELGCEL